MSDVSATDNPRIDDLQLALNQANDDKFFWRLLAIQLMRKYVLGAEEVKGEQVEVIDE